jgi:hypothetical protein
LGCLCFLRKGLCAAAWLGTGWCLSC